MKRTWKLHSQGSVDVRNTTRCGPKPRPRIRRMFWQCDVYANDLENGLAMLVEDIGKVIDEQVTHSTHDTCEQLAFILAWAILSKCGANCYKVELRIEPTWGDDIRHATATVEREYEGEEEDYSQDDDPIF